MTASSDPRPQPSTALPPGLAFVEHWASLVRALAFYPETNSRVSAAVDATLAALSSCHRDKPLRVAFGRGEARVGDERCEFAPGSNTQWLAERLDTCGVAGALFEPGLRAGSLVTFSKQVLDSFRRSTLDPDFEYWNAEPVEHVHVLQRRFEGFFDGGAGGPPLHVEDEGDASTVRSSRMARLLDGRAHAGLAVQLLADPRIEGRVRELFRHYEEAHPDTDESLPALELLSLLVESLPADAMLDLERAANHTLDLLAELDSRAQGAGDGLGEAILRAGLRLFGRETQVPDRAPVVKAIPASGRGHARDDAITDDLDELLREYEQLPRSWHADWQMRDVERSDEQLGVYLHYLVTLESDQDVELLHGPLTRYLKRETPEHHLVLASYIEPLCEGAERPASDLHLRRVLKFLRGNGLTHLLARHGAYSTSLACALFPHDFGAWLDSRDFDRDDHHAELVEVLEQLGGERILEAGAVLVAKARIAEPARARRLLARAHPALIPIARLLLSRGDSNLKGTVALFVRKLEDLGVEDCLLALMPDEELPRDYLAMLLDPPGGLAGRERLHRRISEALCEFIERTGAEPARAPQRLEAVRQLATFESPRSLDLLKDLLRSRRLLFLPAETPELRRAARQALASRA